MATEVYRSELETLVSKGAMLIDVREVLTDDVAALPGHTHVPLSRLAELRGRAGRGTPAVFYCRSGLLSYQAAQMAEAWADQPVYYLSGGLLSYRDD
jgi:rhodanese-related sulfurtransferase